MNTLTEKTLKDSRAIRWTMLVITSLLVFATYWFYDVFSPLKDLMMTDLGIDSGSFGIVVSATKRYPSSSTPAAGNRLQ